MSVIKPINPEEPFAQSGQESPTQTSDVQNEASFNPFDVYTNIQQEIYGENSDFLDNETFDKILSGELETDDMLVLGVIEAARQDEDKTTLSEEELSDFYEKLASGELSDVPITADNQVEQEYYDQYEEMAQMYLGKSAQKCTPQELNNAYALSMLDGVLTSSKNSLIIQDKSDGWISEWFDAFKAANGIDLTQASVEEAIRKQEQIINTLKETLLNGGDFEATWEELTGVKYDFEKIAQHQEKTTELQFVQMGVLKVENFCSKVKEASSKYDFQGILDAYISSYGEQEGKKEFAILFQNYCNNHPNNPPYETNPYYDLKNPITDVVINENNEYIITRKDGTQANIGSVDIATPLNAFKVVQTDQFKENKLNKYLDNLEKATGINYEELVKEYNALSEEALGEANAVSNILNDYISSQEGFINSLASSFQMGGMGLMLVGGIMCFFPVTAPFGSVLASFGQGMALSGTFGDEALELVDTLTNDNFVEGDEEAYKDILKETLTDGALFLAGYTGGNYAKAFGDWVANKGGSQLLAFVADHGSDALMSLASDLIITGEIDLYGEGMSQLLSVFTGSGFARYGSIDKQAFDGAMDVFKMYGYDSAIKHLETQGASTLTIKAFEYETMATRLSDDIELGKITKEDALEQLIAMGADKYTIGQFRYDNNIEPTPLEKMQTLIERHKCDPIYAKEAMLDYELDSGEGRRYCRMREKGFSADEALKINEFCRFGANEEYAVTILKNMSEIEINSALDYCKSDFETKVQKLKELGFEESAAEFYANDGYSVSINFPKFVVLEKMKTLGFNVTDSMKFIDCAKAQDFENLANFNSVDINGKMEILQNLGLSPDIAAKAASEVDVEFLAQATIFARNSYLQDVSTKFIGIKDGRLGWSNIIEDVDDFYEVYKFNKGDISSKIQQLASFGLDETSASTCAKEMSSEEFALFKYMAQNGISVNDALEFSKTGDTVTVYQYTGYMTKTYSEKMEYLKTMGFDEDIVGEIASLDAKSSFEIIDLSHNKVSGECISKVYKSNPENFHYFRDLLNMGVTGSAIEKLLEPGKFGKGFDELTPEKLELLKSLDGEELMAFNIAAASTYGLGGASDVENIKLYYDKINRIIYGEPVDPTFMSNIDAIGSKYGISIKAQNNIGYKGNHDASYIVDEKYLQAIDEALAEMKRQGLELPEEIYLTDLSAENASGVFLGTNKYAITLSVTTLNPDWLKTTVYHETMHMHDYRRGNDGYNSTTKCGNGNVNITTEPRINHKGESTDMIKTIEYNGQTITKEEISGIVRDYAATDPQEFVAEVGTLLVCGAIVTNADGSYTIDVTKIPYGYCSGWTGGKKDIEALQKIMSFYNYLVS